MVIELKKERLGRFNLIFIVLTNYACLRGAILLTFWSSVYSSGLKSDIILYVIITIVLFASIFAISTIYFNKTLLIYNKDNSILTLKSKFKNLSLSIDENTALSFEIPEYLVDYKNFNEEILNEVQYEIIKSRREFFFLPVGGQFKIIKGKETLFKLTRIRPSDFHKINDFIKYIEL